jgi:putative peptide zinc metalloprotease protein
MTRALFSSNWHSVAELRPRLLAGVRIHRHSYRGQLWYVIQDQAGGRFHRISPGAYAMVMRMDGAATVQALWDAACREAQGDIPTQEEVVNLLMQLSQADLLQADVTPDSAGLLERYKKRRSQLWKQWLSNPMSLKLPLLDPDAFLGRWVHRLSWVFGPVGAALWLAAVISGVALAAQHWGELTGNLSDRVLAADNLVLMAAVFPFVKALHELGHGFAVKTWGGQVHEMGIMLLVFAPIPYVEASSASAFPSRIQRAVVGAAGMLVETFLAALALLVWVLAEPGLVHAIAFNVMVVAGVSTLIVNGNPLLRYDAYYILADLVEIPNLAQRGQRYLSYLWDKVVFRARDLQPLEETPGERAWLLCYAVISWCYRLFITVTIILFIAGKYFIFGVLVALWGAFTLFAMPLWKGLQHLLRSPTLRQRRQQAMWLSLALLALLLVVLLAVPMPLRTKAVGVIWLPDQAMIRAGDNGFFLRWLVPSGSYVHRGTPVLALEDPLLAAELKVARARVEEAQARYRVDEYDDRAKAEIAREQLEQARQVLARSEERNAHLIASAETDGVLVAPKPQDMSGQFYKKGELLAYVLEGGGFIARVVVQQDNIDLVRTSLRGVQLRLSDDLAPSYPAGIIREMPGGVDELPTAALGTTGGGPIAVDPKEGEGLKALERIFIFDLRLPPDARPAAFGERVHVRFEHGPEPLARQWYRRLRQLFLSRFNA